MPAYYNENDPFCVEWLWNLMRDGWIADGAVDSRSIEDVAPEDLDGFDQCHFFAGIGGWSYALKLAGWEDNRSVWTGSCPCQPFSAAGQRKGFDDHRHLWPEFNRLISKRHPATVFGEQVASKAGREWLARVRADLETLGYAVGAADLCAAGVGAPHIRQRLYWMADADSTIEYERESSGREQPIRNWMQAGDAGLVDPSGVGWKWREGSKAQDFHDGKSGRWTKGECRIVDAGPLGIEGLGHSATAGLQEQRREYSPSGERCSGLLGFAVQTGVPRWNGPTVALECADGYRRASAQSDAFPVAHGVSARMGKLRGSGNAIVPQVAAAFIEAYLECTPGK